MMRSSIKGLKFGKWTVIERVLNNGRHDWLCVCICGNKKAVQSCHLKSGRSRSCGCNRKNRFTKEERAHPEFELWRTMKKRCRNKNDKSFPKYGGRGIEICDSWFNSIDAFLKDMGKRPSEKHSIDRIDNNGNYERSNCRWATIEEQNRNKSSNVWLEYGGKKMVKNDWAKHLGISVNSLNYRLKNWKDLDKIFSKEKRV
jgi:hypothetical protein